jgi:CheY-like chemotaxis protein
MGSTDRFSVLLVTENIDEIRTVCNLIKRHFPQFYIAKDEESALKIIVDKKIDVLLMGLNTLQANEVFYLHLLSSKQNISNILYRKIVLCSREELKEAFSICNKDVFDDYFIVRPLYDPYHILLRLRFIRRVRDNRDPTENNTFSLDDLCNYFDQVVNCQDVLDELNHDSYEKLLTIVSFSMEKMKDSIFQGGAILPDQQNQIGVLIDEHTEKTLIKDVSDHQKDTHQQLHDAVKNVAEIAKLKKDKLENPQPITPHDCNILLIEDDSTIRDNIKDTLHSAGYKAQMSGSATHAIQLMQTWKPEIIMIDLRLPDMSPLYVINTIKNDPALHNVRILVLAAAGDKDSAAEAMKLGVHEVMRKPVDRDMLIYKIDYNLKMLKKS